MDNVKLVTVIKVSVIIPYLKQIPKNYFNFFFFFQSLEVIFRNVVAILMMASILGTAGLPKIKVF